MASSGLRKMSFIIYINTIGGTGVVFVLFLFGMLNRTMKYCGKWNTNTLAMTGSKAMKLTVLRCFTQLFEECCTCLTSQNKIEHREH